jgi:putative Holliday junction resolvase
MPSPKQAPAPSASPPAKDATQWRILSVDYGKRRTGLAVTDPTRMIATGLAGVETQKLLPWLKAYLAAEPVGLFVVGYPSDAQGRATDATPLVELFQRQLAKRWPEIPVVLEDERYSSKEAMASLVASGVRRKARRNKALLDEVSATLILQAYLDANGKAMPADLEHGWHR